MNLLFVSDISSKPKLIFQKLSRMDRKLIVIINYYYKFPKSKHYCFEEWEDSHKERES